MKSSLITFFQLKKGVEEFLELNLFDQETFIEVIDDFSLKDNQTKMVSNCLKEKTYKYLEQDVG